MSDHVPKESFYAILEKIKNNSRKIYTRQTIDDMINTIIKEKLNPNTKDSKAYYLLNQFKVMEIGGLNKLIKFDEKENKILHVVSYEDMFDIIDEVHKRIGHGGIVKTFKILSKDYDNISNKFVRVYVELCVGCLKKNTKTGSKKVVVKPIVSNGFMNRGQVDLMDYQSMPDREFKWILHYQDHHNKLSFLCALISKCAREVALWLIEIFTFIGAPYILQMDNGREFIANVIKELKLIWKDMIIVHGKPRHPQSQGSIERANGDVKKMLSNWMEDNKTKNWSLGLKFVQMSKNNSYHRTINCTPYFATFGREMNYGIGSSSIPKELITGITTEEELEKILNEHSPERIQNIQEIEEIEQLLVNPSGSSNGSNGDDKEVEEEDVDEIESEEDDDVESEEEDKVDIEEVIQLVEQILFDELLKYLLDTVSKEISQEKCKRGRKRKERKTSEEENKIVDSEEPVPLSKIPCFELNAIKIADIQSTCYDNLKNAADKMAQQHINKLGEAKVGDTVQVPVPDVDRGPADPINILAYITKINKNYMTYQLATKFGIIAGWHTRNKFSICKQKILKVEQLNLNKECSLREINGLHSISGGQGFLKCNCIGKCTKNCTCKKNGVYCNSKCHKNNNNNVCTNKM